MPEMTIEQAQERILALESELETVRTERDTLSQNNVTLSQDLERARTLNQRLFERVTNDKPDDTDPEPDDVPTCEEFAKTITI